MCYLYTMPECRKYVNDIRIKAFTKLVGTTKENWIKSSKERVMTDGDSTYIKDASDDILNYFFDEFMIENFDSYWDIASSQYITYQITDRLRKSFVKLHLKKADVLEQYINNPVNIHPDSNLWVEEASKCLEKRGLNFKMSSDFLDRSCKNYLMLYNHLSLINDKDDL